MAAMLLSDTNLHNHVSFICPVIGGITSGERRIILGDICNIVQWYIYMDAILLHVM